MHLITLLSTQLDKHLVYFGSIIDWQQSIQALLLIPKALFTSLSLPKQKGIYWLVWQGGWQRVEDIYAFRVEENELVYYLFYDFVFFLNANYLSNIAMVNQLITH